MRSVAALAIGLLVMPLAGTVFAHPPSIISDEAEKATAEEVKAFRRTVSEAIDRKDAAALRLIYDEYLHELNWPLGAAIALALLVVNLVIMLGYNAVLEGAYAKRMGRT